MAGPTRQQPNKVLVARITAARELDIWPYEDYPGDPYWQGGVTPKPYKWEIDVTISTQSHGDTSTRESKQYNGEDIYVGDWITDTVAGKGLKITNILEKTTNSITAVVEDVDRYNTFMDNSGSGIFTVPSDGLVFEISDDKSPILNPLPVVGSITFLPSLTGRFLNNNPLYRYRFIQQGHRLTDNDAVWVDPVDGLIKTVTSDDNLKRMIGTVDQVGPGEDVFYVIPTTKVVEELDPPLPGNAGDIIYSDPFDGSLSVNPTARTKVAYIQLTNATNDETISTSSLVTPGSVLTINDIDVTFTGNTMASVVNNINSLTDQHGVASELISGINSVSTDSSQLSYGICACIGLTASIRINGILVEFNDDTNGQIEHGFSAVNAVDMEIAINAANIPDISAVGVGSTSLQIFNNAGGSIDIVNVTSDDSSVPWGGNASCSGVQLSTAPGGDDFITFTNALGNGIIFKNTTGTPVFDLGLSSVRNGKLPLGLVVEQFVVEGGTGIGVTVYPTINDLPGFGVVGEQAYIIDSEDAQGNKAGEWTMYLWDGFKWSKTSDEDSATTDAKTIQANILFNGPERILVGTLSGGRKVTSVMVEIFTIFDGSPTLDIGDGSTTNSLMSDDYLDLSTQETYSSNPDFIYTGANDVNVYATFVSGGATKGTASVIVTYV